MTKASKMPLCRFCQNNLFVVTRYRYSREIAYCCVRCKQTLDKGPQINEPQGMIFSNRTPVRPEYQSATIIPPPNAAVKTHTNSDEHDMNFFNNLLNKFIEKRKARRLEKARARTVARIKDTNPVCTESTEFGCLVSETNFELRKGTHA